MPTQASLWATLEERTGRPLSPEVRRLLECLGAVNRWQRAASAGDRDALVRAGVQLVRALEESGLLRSETLAVEVDSPAGRSDGRWELWRALRWRVLADNDDDRRWSPFEATHVYDFMATPALHAQRIELSFDARLSLGAVLGTLRRLWPRMREAGWLQQTHPLGARKLALVEFVCLKTAPDTDWREMLATWNDRHAKWAFRSVRGFQGEFRRAEKSLTGECFGLEWFYRLQARPESRGQLSWEQTTAMLSDDATAEERRLAARLFAPLRAGAQQLTVAFVPWIRWAQGRAAAGLSVEGIADELREHLPEQRPVILESGDQEDPRETALRIVRGLLESGLAELPQPGPGNSRVDYPGAPTVVRRTKA